LKIVSRIVDYLDNFHRYAVSAPWFSVHKNKKTKQNKTKQSKKKTPKTTSHKQIVQKWTVAIIVLPPTNDIFFVRRNKC
jgi:hypothetical protein